MLQLEFTPDTLKKLAYERYHHPHPRVQKKMNVVYLKSQGMAHKDIKRIECICEGTLLKYFRQYQEGGVDRLKAINFYSPKSELTLHTQTIEDYFRETPPATIKEAAAKIAELTGVKRSPEQVRIFLKKQGLKHRKVGMIPAKADVDVQKKFVVEELEPRISEAEAGNRTLFL